MDEALCEDTGFMPTKPGLPAHPEDINQPKELTYVSFKLKDICQLFP